MRFINLVTITAVAASAIPSNTNTEEETVAEVSTTTVKPTRGPSFYEEWANFLQAMEKLVDKVVEQAPSADDGYSKRYAPFPGVIGI